MRNQKVQQPTCHYPKFTLPRSTLLDTLECCCIQVTEACENHHYSCIRKLINSAVQDETERNWLILNAFERCLDMGDIELAEFVLKFSENPKEIWNMVYKSFFTSIYHDSTMLDYVMKNAPCPSLKTKLYLLMKCSYKNICHILPWLDLKSIEQPELVLEVVSIEPQNFFTFKLICDQGFPISQRCMEHVCYHMDLKWLEYAIDSYQQELHTQCLDALIAPKSLRLYSHYQLSYKSSYLFKSTERAFLYFFDTNSYHGDYTYFEWDVVSSCLRLLFSNGIVLSSKYIQLMFLDSVDPNQSLTNFSRYEYSQYLHDCFHMVDILDIVWEFVKDDSSYEWHPHIIALIAKHCNHHCNTDKTKRILQQWFSRPQIPFSKEIYNIVCERPNYDMSRAYVFQLGFTRNVFPKDSSMVSSFGKYFPNLDFNPTQALNVFLRCCCMYFDSSLFEECVQTFPQLMAALQHVDNCSGILDTIKNNLNSKLGLASLKTLIAYGFVPHDMHVILENVEQNPKSHLHFMNMMRSSHPFRKYIKSIATNIESNANLVTINKLVKRSHRRLEEQHYHVSLLNSKLPQDIVKYCIKPFF